MEIFRSVAVVLGKEWPQRDTKGTRKISALLLFVLFVPLCGKSVDRSCQHLPNLPQLRQRYALDLLIHRIAGRARINHP